MKQLTTLDFDGGTISVKTGGYPEHEIGGAELTFLDDDMEQSDELGLYRVATIDRSEMIAIRDFLNAVLPDGKQRTA